jgi:hypothetical protein
MDDAVRVEVVRVAARRLALFALAHDTLDSLRVAYDAGELDGMSIRKDLRQHLQRGRGARVRSVRPSRG